MEKLELPEIITSEKSPSHDWHGKVFEWERDVDPWHKDAFPPEFRNAGTQGRRRDGWMGLDSWGNPIVFVPDTFRVCNGKTEHYGERVHSEMDEEITYHKLHCIECDNHLTSLMHCPICNKRFEATP